MVRYPTGNGTVPVPYENRIFSQLLESTGQGDRRILDDESSYTPEMERR